MTQRRSYAKPFFLDASASCGHLASRRTRLLLGLFAVGLVIPMADVPGWGISLSTPIFCLLALDLSLGREPLDWRPYRKWILLASLFWMGQFVSLAGNIFSGQLAQLAVDDWLHLLRLSYWMAVFLVTAALVSRWSLGPCVCSVLAVSLIGLASLRLVEAVSLGTWGTARALLYTPNGYGFLFSTFTPFLVWLVLSEMGWRRLFYGLGLLVTVFAIAGNGSRSSWAAVALGAFLASLLFALRQSRSFARLGSLGAAAVVPAFLAVLLVPSDLLRPVVDRFWSLDRLNEDKSYAARLVLLKKARDLFSQNPVLGIGAGRFRRADAPLEIPALLHAQREQELNRRSPHNSYAGLLAESGLLGAAPLAALLFVLARRGWLAAWRGSHQSRAWIIPVYAAFAGMSLHLTALSGLTGAAPWFVYGLVAAAIQKSNPWRRQPWRKGRPFLATADSG